MLAASVLSRMPSARLQPYPAPVSWNHVLLAVCFDVVCSQTGQQKYPLYKLLISTFVCSVFLTAFCLALHFMLGQESISSLFWKAGGEQLSWDKGSEDETGWGWDLVAAFLIEQETIMETIME